MKDKKCREQRNENLQHAGDEGIQNKEQETEKLRKQKLKQRHVISKQMETDRKYLDAGL